MITVSICCPHCHQAEPVVKHGTTDSGTPRCRCKACQKTFALNPKSRAVTAEKEAAIERHLCERTSIRGICRALKVGPNTIYATLKKVDALPPFEESVLPPERGDTIEADEVWAYAGSKQNQAWIWLSWSFQTTQTLSFAVGPRDTATGRDMWERLPADWKRKQVYTDALNIYASLIPYRQHWVCPKGSADTNIAEGCNNYLRHRVHACMNRVSYLVRDSPSFARKVEWLQRRLYLVLYNRNQQIKSKLSKKP